MINENKPVIDDELDERTFAKFGVSNVNISIELSSRSTIRSIIDYKKLYTIIIITKCIYKINKKWTKLVQIFS